MPGQKRQPVVGPDRAPRPAGRVPSRLDGGRAGEGLLGMQDAFGNQAACEALHLSSGVSSPGDPVEVEADRVAGAVARGEPAPAIQPVQGLELAGNWLTDIRDAVGNALDSGEDGGRIRAEEEIQDFYAHSYAPLQDYTPSSGLGLFDASFDPASSRLTVTLKVGFDFVAGNQANTVAGFRPEEYQWTPGEQDTFASRFTADMSRGWSAAAFTFQCTRPYWEAVQASVGIRVVRDEGDPHFRVIVEKYPRNADSIRSSVCPAGYHHSADRATCQANTAPAGGGAAPNSGTTVLSSNDLEEEPMLDASAAAVSIRFGPGDAGIPAGEQGKLDGVIASLEADPAAHAHITGHSDTSRRQGATAAQGAVENMDLARQRSAAVQAALTARGISAARITIRDQGQAGSSAGAADRRADIQVGNQSRFNTALHETGHMLGLGDEYVDTGRPAGSQVEAGYHGMVQTETGTNLTTADNDSVMSMGTRIQPWHASPFLEALKRITSMNEWSL